MATWQVQKAKAHFSEVLEDAKTKGPQIITRHGSETAVVLSITEYRNLTTASATPKMDLRDFLLSGPKFGEDLDITRDRDTGREIDLD